MDACSASVNVTTRVVLSCTTLPSPAISAPPTVQWDGSIAWGYATDTHPLGERGGPR